jgi:hypothetical protein
MAPHVLNAYVAQQTATSEFDMQINQCAVMTCTRIYERLLRKENITECVPNCNQTCPKWNL